MRFDPFQWWGGHDPGRVAVIDRQRATRVTYGELDALIDRWAVRLVAVGTKPGGRVASLAGNRVEQIAALYACGRIGASLVPLNWRLASAELGRIVASCRPVVTLGEDRHRELAEAAGIERWIDVDRDVPRERRSSMPEAAQADDIAMILYTSGSTGEPKGAMIPHRQLLANALATTTAWELGPQDVAPIATPLFHTGGWNVFATPLWMRGGRVVLFDQFDPASYIEGLAEEGCTVALTIPTQMGMMLESSAWGRELPALRWFISGGAPCPSSVVARVREAGFSMKEGYGLTECGPNCFAITDREALEHEGTVGRPVPLLETRVIRGDASPCEPDEPGELLLRGSQRFAGYFENPAQTAAAIDETGWLHTGDVASVDAAGRYFIRGRKKDMFISGGENVYPGEVESALAEHAAIAEIVVIGVADPRWGEVGRAFVTLRDGGEIVPDALRAWARARLAGYKVPKEIVVMDAMPRLGSGKVDRAALARLAAPA